MSRVKPGQSIAESITAADYNRMLDAAEAFARNKLPGGNAAAAAVHRSTGIVRVGNSTGDTIPIGGAVALGDAIADPMAGDVQLARFARDITTTAVVPTSPNHFGRVAIAVEPIGTGRVGRVVADGVVAARVHVRATWHTMADLTSGSVAGLTSQPAGSAEILYRRYPAAVGWQWCIVRLGNTLPQSFFVKPPAAGIPAMVGATLGTATGCPLFQLLPDGSVTAVTNSADDPIAVDVLNPSAQPIQPPPALQLVQVRPDARTDRWLANGPAGVLVGTPVAPIAAGTWGMMSTSTGQIVSVYSVCGYALHTDDTLVAHYHADVAAYVTTGARCCEDSNSSSSSSGSSSSNSSSSGSSSSNSSSSGSSSSNSSSSGSSSSGSSSGARYCYCGVEEDGEVYMRVRITGGMAELPFSYTTFSASNCNGNGTPYLTNNRITKGCDALNGTYLIKSLNREQGMPCSAAPFFGYGELARKPITTWDYIYYDEQLQCVITSTNNPTFANDLKFGIGRVGSQLFGYYPSRTVGPGTPDCGISYNWKTLASDDTFNHAASAPGEYHPINVKVDFVVL